MIRKYYTAALAAILLVFSVGIGANLEAREDARQLIKLPEMMQDHMLANMRDHLKALDEIVEALSKGNVEQATQTAEKRLGMSSMGAHGAEHMGQFMPKAMSAIGIQMHKAASQFVIIAKDAELNPGAQSQKEIYQALHEIMQNCNSCHENYRIR